MTNIQGLVHNPKHKALLLFVRQNKRCLDHFDFCKSQKIRLEICASSHWTHCTSAASAFPLLSKNGSPSDNNSINCVMESNQCYMWQLLTC